MKERIKLLRRMFDLSQQSFADRLGVKRGTIVNYEIGRNEPVPAIISLICREFNVSEKWLRTGKGEMFLPEPKSELEALTKRYDLSATDEFFVEKFVNLTPDLRKVIADFFVSLSTND